MKDKLKIAVYSGDIPSTTFIERLILGLSSKGHQIYLFGFIKKKTTYNSNVSVAAYTNTKIKKTFYLLKYSILLYFFKHQDKLKLDKILKTQSRHGLYNKVKCYPVLWHKPDVFHIQWAKGLDDWIWVQDFGIKLIVSLRGAHINYSPIADAKLAFMYQNNFPKVDHFHAVSKAIGLEAEKYKASKEKISVVYSGLNLDVIEKYSQVKNNMLEIISIGRPHWKKGYHYALDACKILKDKNINFKYVIVGGANDIELAYQVKDLELQDEVTLVEQLSFSEVQERIQVSNLLLLPSVEEGIANVVLEAMALGTLVLTTDCGGMAEVIKDRENGFIIPIRDSKQIAKKIVDISSMPENERQEVIKNAKKTIKVQHTEEKMVNDMLALYKKVSN